MSLLLPMLSMLVLKSSSGDISKPMAHCAMMMADTGTSDNPQPSPHKAPDKLPSCPICQNLNILSHGYVAPTIIAVSILLLTKGVGLAQAASIFTPTQSILIAWPRAPPRA